MRIAGIVLLLLMSVAAPALGDDFISLCFHDVRPDVGRGDDLSMSTDRFVALLTWLRQHHYQPIGIDDLLRARQGEKPLPEKAVLLTFDDGYRGFYSQVFPLLKAYRYPAVLAVVGSWLDAAPGETVDYGGKLVPREKFLSWPQLREMAESGLVEIASHSYNGHGGILANPQGNWQPIYTARGYDPETGHYENDATYIARIRADLEKGADLIERKVGVRPRVMVWPFGKYSKPAVGAASKAGMSVALGLGDGPGDTDHLTEVKRFLIEGSLPLSSLAWRLRNLLARDSRRVVQVDLDYIYDPNPEQTERNLGLLLDRIKAMQITTVYLQAFADPDGDGVADALYFPNDYLPVRADLFNRVAWQLKTRAGVKVYAWLPVLGFEIGRPDLLVLSQQPETGKISPDPHAYKRLSPFVPEVRALVHGIYGDLARYADFDGVLFHDDAVLSSFEDAQPAAMAWRRERGLKDDLAGVWSEEERTRWSRLKTEYLIVFTQELADAVRAYRPEIETARNLYAPAVLASDGKLRFSQDPGLFLEAYDFTALMAMPYLEGASDPESWLRKLVAAIACFPDGLKKTVFELQSIDWNGRKQPVPTETLARHMRLLQSLGAVNFGYYPDDFHRDHPAATSLYSAFSVNSDPFEK
ncbi:outer membrane polysaccharide N-deacetylase [Syntrophotalea carbinolica DSM 2380]|uniref:Outer membrane polysaccharide N-deacetylase n=1 Tax=Syntrophotalea carbinolica (strain DSM 2380 / NBRC 103641 / GraBd1) TaxID=338963 RepID=Q3A0T1_SYNC1|nr:poly-beta-1,6-N-acetyl-D-glucosamine N-deacetylase PgaB [Syntrophotalea carbinolica]ABA90026.1 outer membrane polysaccharide N-deacetylase [Syntrophotalea carbinolica DSM 2380]